jgi:uncharacterized membrane protein YbhN (UPF0104 family)
MKLVLASNPPAAQLPIPAFELRSLGRRAAVPVLLAGIAVAGVLLAGRHVHAFAEGVAHGLDVSPGWAALGVAFECASLAGYVALLSLVAGRATARIGARESAQITLAGAAATRLLPTAGVGGLGLTVWALRRAGLRSRVAARTLLVFLVVLYAAFLAAIVACGSLLASGVVGSHGPVELSACAAGAALLGIALALVLGARHGSAAHRGDARAAAGGASRSRLDAGSHVLGEAVHDARGLLRSGDARLAGALAYWTFDAAVLWTMMRAFGSPPVLPVVALAYFIGQVANTVPVPGSVTGGMTGVLIVFGVPAELALAAVLAYRGISVWLPAPVAIAAVPALRRTIGRWERADADAGTRRRVHA